MELAISEGKNQILRDVRFGTVPPTVRSFAHLHDHVDANGYGHAFDWPVLPSETDETHQQIFANFWNCVQDRLSDLHSQATRYRNQRQETTPGGGFNADASPCPGQSCRIQRNGLLYNRTVGNRIDLHKDWSANRLGAFVFISADRALNAAATAEGLTVEDPNSHP